VYALNSCRSGKGTVAGFFELGTEHLCFIKEAENSYQLTDYQFIKKESTVWSYLVCLLVLLDFGVYLS
jgi:hypothetical protein